MVGAREDEMGETELMDAMKPLQLRTAQEPEEDALDLHATVNSVLDDLEIWHRSKICSRL